LRYSSFDDIIRGRKDISTIAVGHNATDNIETVLFHLLRGCGSVGLSGIAPVRDNIIRPLISLSKAEVLSALAEENIPYVVDETNSDPVYTRNYIRKEILPKLERLSSNPEVSVGRVCRNLICDNDFLEQETNRFYSCIDGAKGDRVILASLHPAIFARVMLRWGRTFGSELSHVHVEQIYSLLKKKAPFSLNLPAGLRFFADIDLCYLEKQVDQDAPVDNFAKKILPEQSIALARGVFSLSHGDIQNISPNIYNFSIKANLRSAIIEGELFIRYRRAGDSYYYGGMTHKLKKLFNDKKMPLKERETLPILCDEKGIVWVPGFSVRDDGADAANALNAAFFFSK
jgi:tRNA(Ile)-lysidine synthase